MSKLKRVLSAVSLCLAMCLLAVSAQSGGDFVKVPEQEVPMAGYLELVEEGEHDRNVIPDKFNSGCDEAQITTKMESEGKYGGLTFKLGADQKTLAVDFVYGNSKVADQVIIRDTDFSKYKVSFRKGTEIAGKKEIIFENCKFKGVGTDYAAGNVSYIFRRCTLTNFVGSSASFENCTFGGTINDALNPVQDVTLTSCYIADLAHAADKVIHTDGTQIYGKDGIDAQNITYKNCRMEVPKLKKSGSNSGCYVNACLMVQLEYSNANNLLFEDCIINGGGYSIYAWDKNLGYELNNVVFRNIQVGNSHQYDNIYYRSAPTVVYDNVYDTEKLYVASVWKDENGKIHLSVSNDTETERTLLVVTDKGRQEFQIPACKKYGELPVDMEFEELPFDIDIEVDGNNWVVCYDGSEHAQQQIRFVNWSGEEVYRQASQTDSLVGSDEAAGTDAQTEDDTSAGSAQEIIETEGQCGTNATYKVDSEGTLTISGNGTMNNFTSGSPSPWQEIKEHIKNVVIEDGITSVGTQAFYKCKQLSEVSLPETLETIKDNAFLGCSSLEEIAVPESIHTIGKKAFNSTNVSTVYYAGSEDAYGEINVAANNEKLAAASVEFNCNNASQNQIIAEGACGQNLSYSLDSEGALVISGSGGMTNYTSGSPAPWKAHKDTIKQVILEEGITGIGNQAFYKCTQISGVSFPGTLEKIGSNAFMGCTLLTEVTLPGSLRSIGKRAFDATGLSAVTYLGTEEMFGAISIGDLNTLLVNSPVTYIPDGTMQ